MARGRPFPTLARMTSSTIEPRRVVIVGGGIAALEGLLALHELGEAQLRITLVAPHEHFVLKPLTVREPFGRGLAPRLGLAEVLTEHGGTFVRDVATRVDPARKVVTCASGDELPYDELLLVPGARARPVYEHALTFGVNGSEAAMGGLIADLEQELIRSVAFVVPRGTSWSLPLYELALMTAEQVWSTGVDDLELTFITPEPTPLAIFGAAASAAVSETLDQAGVQFVGGVEATVRAGGRINLGPESGLDVHFDRVVSLPRLEGPRIEGVPSDLHGFLMVDLLGRLHDTPHVHAAGDGTNIPVKQGGLACQQVDVAAADIAAGAGADVEVKALQPVLRGRLLTGRGDRFLRRPLRPSEQDGEASAEPLWWPPAKVASKYLSSYLATQGVVPERPATTPPEGLDVEVPLWVPPSMDASTLGLDPYGPATPRGSR